MLKKRNSVSDEEPATASKGYAGENGTSYVLIRCVFYSLSFVLSFSPNSAHHTECMGSPRGEITLLELYVSHSQFTGTEAAQPLVRMTLPGTAF